jgi:hypothetical protein
VQQQVLQRRRAPGTAILRASALLHRRQEAPPQSAGRSILLGGKHSVGDGIASETPVPQADAGASPFAASAVFFLPPDL